MTDQAPTSEEAPSSALPPTVIMSLVVVVFICLLMAAWLFYFLWERAMIEEADARLAETIPTDEPSEEVQELLRPLDGATSVRHDPGVYWSYHVAYFVTEPYPADDVIDHISSRLDSLGWTPLSDDWLNPGNPSSHVRGWTDFDDATRAPHRHVHQWMGQWEDASGNVVAYSFEYSFPIGAPPDLMAIWVNGSWYPQAGVRQMQTPVINE